MQKLIVLALVSAAGTVCWARQPMIAPLGTTMAAFQAPGTVTPSPTPNLTIPPSPGVVPQTSSQPNLTPIPETGHPPVPGYLPGQIPMTSGAIITQPCIVCDAAMGPMFPLYPKVRVIQPRNIAPCAVPKIVAVPDPCQPCGCVFISICVPAGACENVYTQPHAERVVFDYGKYAVKVTNRRGTLVVNYDD
jgi:hypothetical protein